MPTVTGTLLDGAGSGLNAVAITFDTVGDPLALTAAQVRSRTRVSATTESDGDFTVSLAGGAWRARWFVGALLSEVIITVPVAGGPYSFGNLMFYRAPETAQADTWFDTVDAMVQTASSGWTRGMVRDTYGTGRITGWMLILKSSPEATGITAGDDSVLETSDGLGFAVRTWSAS